MDEQVIDPNPHPIPDATPALDSLCRQVGIATTYEDDEGRQRRADDATRRALLRALGIPAGDAGTEQRSIDELTDRAWRRRLPPVLVHRQGDPAPTLELTLPAGLDSPLLRFVMTEESGERADTALDLGALPVEGRREIDGETWLLRRISVPPPGRTGYHRLGLLGADNADPAAAPMAETTVIVAPRRCWQPGNPAGEPMSRGWGLATQLHAVRSGHNWGIGDFTDLTRLVEIAAAAGAGMLALSPLHALFLTQPERCDPYAPSSRRYLNPLYIDVEALPELAQSEALRARIDGDDFQAMLRALRTEPLVDYAGVARAKLDILTRLFRELRESHPAGGEAQDGGSGAAPAQDLRGFRDAHGADLERFALYQALAEHFAGADNGGGSGTGSHPAGFEAWPAEYRDADGAAARAFAREHAERVEFFIWLQWLARRQLDAVAERCAALGMRHGLCLDLAVGAAPDGADRWAAPARYVAGAHAGAPPDDFSPKGQSWHVLAWHPERLREAAYAPFAAELRASMRAAGALRIDHVMGLMRLFLVPEGTDPRAATYVAYPFADLLGVLALESVRNRCMIIGEDLGTVPYAVRTALPDWGILSTRVLYFERDADGGFLPPADMEPNALVTADTHDLPPMAGFWTGVDLEHRRELALFPTEQDYERRLLQRSHDRTRLLLALDREGLLPDDTGADPVSVPELTPEHRAAIQVYLARSPSRELMIQTADLLGETEQTNLPGSGDAHPNWRRRQPLELEFWLEQPGVARLLAAVRAERGGGAGPTAAGAGDSEARARASAETAPETQPALAAIIPRATYRLQLHADFGFAEATELVPYLADLGISHLYSSPLFKARPGSTHGYDVVAHDQLNPELGSRADYDRLCDTLAAHGMGQILDVVPNHVGIMGGDNPWWLDVLENGQSSQYAAFFDIEWQPLKQELKGKVLVPVLGDHYGAVLDRGELKLVFEAGAFRVDYYEHRFPIDPRTYPSILAHGLPALRERLGEDSDALAAFESLVTAFGNLPSRDALDQESLAERRRDKELHKQRLAALCAAHADLARYLRDRVRELNGSDGYAADTGRLHALLDAQAFRLAHWRVAADEINYRRFFDINHLAALRVEHPATFDAVHALVLELIAEGRLDGLRIDHPDGLYDPQAYFLKLQRKAAAALAPARAPRDDDRPLYLLAEKILAADEPLRTDWALHGTTGYDFAALCDALLVDPDGEQALTDAYREFTGRTLDFADECYEAKRLVMRHLLSGELHRLASALSRIAEMDPHTRDYTLDALREALMDVVACFPVYRTYLSERGGCDSDRHQVLKAVSEARRRTDMPDLSVLDFVRDVLLTDIADGKPEPYRLRVRDLALKFQQYTSPVAAKGVEDTAFYRWSRLVSLNEVGGDPERFGIDIDTFHRACTRRRSDWPDALLAGSTHDSKRSEDVRARLHVLSELPRPWRERVRRWSLLNRRLRRTGAQGDPLPDANAEYLLYQTLVGVWPCPTTTSFRTDEVDLLPLRERVRTYMAKAVKEAKLHTAWTNADPDYEAALDAFVDAVMDPERSSAFLEDFTEFLRPVARIGLLNALSLLLLRLTAPGVPDIYQGTELLDLSLVDPDNRRPVDFAQRRRLLDHLPDPAAGAQPPDWDHIDGSAKLFLLHRALSLRARLPGLFARGDYRPLTVTGPLAGHLVAFARMQPGHCVVALAPRLLAKLVLARDIPRAKPRAAPGGESAVDPFAYPGWAATLIEMPGAVWLDQLGGGRLQTEHRQGRHLLCAADVLTRFPVGLLSSTDCPEEPGT